MSTQIRWQRVSLRARGGKLPLFVGFAAAAVLSSATLPASPAGSQRTFATPKAAADALVAAAAQFDSAALLEILGPGGNDLVASGDAVLDKKTAGEFAAEAKEKLVVVPDKKNPKRATVNV